MSASSPAQKQNSPDVQVQVPTVTVTQDGAEQQQQTAGGGPPQELVEEAAAGGTVYAFDPDADPKEKARQAAAGKDKLEPLNGVAQSKTSGQGEHAEALINYLWIYYYYAFRAEMRMYSALWLFSFGVARIRGCDC
jgi:hypothetical protein